MPKNRGIFLKKWGISVKNGEFSYFPKMDFPEALCIQVSVMYTKNLGSFIVHNGYTGVIVNARFFNVPLFFVFIFFQILIFS